MTARSVVLLVLFVAFPLRLSSDPGQPVIGKVEGVEVAHVWRTEGDVAKRSLFSRFVGGAEADLFVRPYAVSWYEGTLYVTDPGRSVVLGIIAGQRPLRSPDNAVRSPVGVTSCQGWVFVADSELGEIIRFSPDLRTSRRLELRLSRPTGVACAGERLFAVETAEHRIVEIEDGRIVSSFGRRGRGDGEFNFPTLIAAHHGELYVGDAMNFRVQRFDLEGQFLGSFGEIGDTPGTMPRMKGIAIDRYGNLWMTDAYLDRVSVFDSSGRFLLDIGGRGEDDGEFSFPAGVAVGADGRVAVSDSYNARVQILTLHIEDAR